MLNTGEVTGDMPKVLDTFSENSKSENPISDLDGSIELLVISNPGDASKRRLGYITVDDLTFSKSKVLPMSLPTFSTAVYDGDYQMIVQLKSIAAGVGSSEMDSEWAKSLPDLSLINSKFDVTGDDCIVVQHTRVLNADGETLYRYQSIQVSNGDTFYRFTYNNFVGDELWGQWILNNGNKVGDVVNKMMKVSDFGKNKDGFISLTKSSLGGTNYLEKTMYPKLYEFSINLGWNGEVDGDDKVFYLYNVYEESIEYFGELKDMAIVPCIYAGFPIIEE